MDDEELEAQIKRFKTLVFWVGLVVIASSNSTGFYSLLYPERIERAVRPDKFTETMWTNRSKALRFEILQTAESIVKDMQKECDAARSADKWEDEQEMDKLRERLTILETRFRMRNGYGIKNSNDDIHIRTVRF